MTTRADRSDPAGARASDGGPPDAPGRSARPIGPPVWTIGVAAFLLVGALTMRVLIGNDLDPSAFVAFGEDSPVQTPYGRRLLGDVVTRPRTWSCRSWASSARSRGGWTSRST